jgi:predicted aspartyl protease
MSMFRVNVVARNPKREELETPPLEALVDTGSELTWLPADVLTSAGITPRRKRIFTTATQQKVEREVGYAILSAEGYETNDEVVFAEPGDMTLLGVRTLEGFGVMVDNIAHRFVATTTIVAAIAYKRLAFGQGSLFKRVRYSPLCHRIGPRALEQPVRVK